MVRLIMLLVVMASASTVLASKAVVNIVNIIAIGPPIQVHCKLGNIVDVIPERTLAQNERVGWGFTPNVWGTTSYNCDFKWGDLTQGFDVWWDDFFLSIWIERPCTHCLWTVGEDGFFRAEAGGGVQSLVHLWN